MELQPKWGRRGMAVAPHSLAAESAVSVLREGGNALEAMIAAAATIAVVYPHMNSIGGDSFWVIHRPGHAMGGIDACGASAGLASRDWYAQRGMTQAIPFRGPVAANTVAGTISGWGAAHQLSRQSLGGRLPLQRLLDDAITYAQTGVPVTHSQHQLTAAKLPDLKNQPGFSETFLQAGQSPATGSVFLQPKLAATLEHIARVGTDDFYRGDLAHSLARDLERLGSPLRLDDLQGHRARLVNPLTLTHSQGRVHNMTPPTQGLMSLIILGLLVAATLSDRVLLVARIPLEKSVDGLDDSASPLENLRRAAPGIGDVELRNRLARFLLRGDTVLRPVRGGEHAEPAFETIYEGYAINEVVVSRGATASMVELRAEIDGQFVANYRADGLIVSSPTGSTAYALSAGGPIMHPGLGGWVLVPIASHTLSNRPIVVSDTGTITIEIVAGRDASMNFDMQSLASLLHGDRVTVRRSPHRVRFLHPTGWNYYATLRRKLRWNEGVS